MNRRSLVIVFLIALLSGYAFCQTIDKEKAKQKLSRVKVASLYERVATDRAVIGGRKLSDAIKLLKETSTDMIFRGFRSWTTPVPECPEDIPPELFKIFDEHPDFTLEQACAFLKETGFYYKELKEVVSAVKKEMPNCLFVGAISVQSISKIEQDPLTGKMHLPEDTWKMALDPQKWKLKRFDKPETKEGFQKGYATQHFQMNTEEGYDWNKAVRFFPDITNPDFQELVLSCAKAQIDAGVDAIWFDNLYAESEYFYEVTRSVEKPAMSDSITACSRFAIEIHKYGESKGKYIYVGSGITNFITKFEKLPKGLLPELDFITVSPSIMEISERKLAKRWEKDIGKIKSLHNTPIFAFINWEYSNVSQMPVFSQTVTKQDQRETIKILDEAFSKIGINFIYPVYGGFMGTGKRMKLSFKRYRTYDSLAPEFETYEAIKALAQIKAKGKKGEGE